MKRRLISFLLCFIIFLTMVTSNAVITFAQSSYEDCVPDTEIDNILSGSLARLTAIDESGNNSNSNDRTSLNSVETLWTPSNSVKIKDSYNAYYAHGGYRIESVSNYKFQKGANYIYTVPVKKYSDGEKTAIDESIDPTFVVSYYHAGVGISGGNYDVHTITETEEWTVLTGMWTYGYDDTSLKFCVGLPFPTINEVINSDPAMTPQKNVGVVVNEKLIRLEAETACTITNTASKQSVIAGGSLTCEAQILNQLGEKGGLKQGIEWIALNKDRTEIVDTISVTDDDKDGVADVIVGADTPCGEYVVLANSTDYADLRQGAVINVVYDDVSLPDGSSIEVTCDGDTTFGVTEGRTLTAKTVKNEEILDGEYSYTWTALKSDKATFADKINIVSSENTKEAEISLELDVEEGDYYIMVRSVGMAKLFKITVDKSGDIDAISQAITGDDASAEKIAEKMLVYLKILEIDSALTEAADKTNLAALLMNDDTVEADKDILREAFIRNSVVSLYNISNPEIQLADENYNFKYADVLKLDAIDEGRVTIWSLFNGDEEIEKLPVISEEGKKALWDIIDMSDSEERHESYEGFINSVKEGMFLCTLAYPDTMGLGYVADVLTEDNLSAIGVDGTKYLELKDKSEVNKTLTDKLLTKEELSDILSSAEEPSEEGEDEDGSIGGGSSGSRGGSFGGGGVSVIAGDFDTKDDEKNAQTQPQKDFADVPDGYWAASDIYFLRNIGVIDGVSDNEFLPDGNVTREQFVKMIVTAFKLTGQNNTVDFSDVDRDAWFAPYVDTAVACGIVNGYASGNFGVGDNITRQDVSVILARVLEFELDESTSLKFDDASTVAGYAKASVEALVEHAIISGFTDNTFRPADICSRAQAAKLIATALRVQSALEALGGESR